MTYLDQPRRLYFFTIILIVFTIPAFAQRVVSTNFKTSFKDSSAYSLFKDHPVIALNDTRITKATEPSIATVPEDQLTNKIDLVIKEPQERKKLLSYLKTIEVQNTTATSQAKVKFYYHMANIFARLRLYPLAMKCFLKTVPKTAKEKSRQPESVTDTDSDTVDTTEEQYLAINSKDDSLVNNHAAELKLNNPVESKAITYERIRQTFDDGKKAVAYAMLFHVKQPARGKRKIFVLNNVGHTFITLIKYNSDSTYTSVSVGFYPKKDNLLSATPLIPSTSSVFKDDSGHAWDEILGKFISKRKFEKIQGLIGQYNGIKYNLSKNNCTDFGIKAAQLAGISMKETYGTWPLGCGNNPAITGQSILEHKFSNADMANANAIFMDAFAAVTQQ
ncbi:hypothetical protein BDD43_5385 [Mucilaginibacter gracilis]|uniref:Uncharacterized protein n=1 Tax=Mucilaginibacter gracilis TaxID=423350 RepID=A0A495J810_9SPHI|nr:hypothetical protein [Mucilaginibacter gracilis]RKR85126.1 hypothetical protein BDD43_5385 [Mucilaginibacter gracilis]